MKIRVYYEDTDLAGIVYYANYFKYIERGRTEFLRDLGVDQMALKAQTGVVFAVRHVDADFLKPAKMDDVLDVRSDVETVHKARIVMNQEVSRDGVVLFKAVVTLVCLNATGRPTRIPEEISSVL